MALERCGEVLDTLDLISDGVDVEGAQRCISLKRRGQGLRPPYSHLVFAVGGGGRGRDVLDRYGEALRTYCSDRVADDVEAGDTCLRSSVAARRPAHTSSIASLPMESAVMKGRGA